MLKAFFFILKQSLLTFKFLLLSLQSLLHDYLLVMQVFVYFCCNGFSCQPIKVL